MEEVLSIFCNVGHELTAGSRPVRNECLT